MNEVQNKQAIRIPHQSIMDFYNRIKDIVLLYPKLRSIQEKVDEEKGVFSCIITITELLPSSDEMKIRGEILALIRDIISPTFPREFQNTLPDITFVVREDAPKNVEKTTGKIRGFVGRLFGSSPQNRGLGLGFVLDAVSDTGGILGFPMTSISSQVSERGSDFRGIDMSDTSPIAPEKSESFTGEVGLRGLCEKVQEMFNIALRYTIISGIPGGTVIFTIYGSAPRDQAEIVTFLSINLPKEFRLVLNKSVSFSFKTLRDFEETE